MKPWKTHFYPSLSHMTYMYTPSWNNGQEDKNITKSSLEDDLEET